MQLPIQSSPIIRKFNTTKISNIGIFSSGTCCPCAAAGGGSFGLGSIIAILYVAITIPEQIAVRVSTLVADQRLEIQEEKEVEYEISYSAIEDS